MSAGGRTALLLTFARRGEEELAKRAARDLGEKLPGATVTAVGTPVSAPVLREVGVGEIIIYGNGRGARTVIREARARRPAAAAIVYWSPNFAGHLKLEILALLAGARRVYRFVPDGDPKQAGRVCLAWSVLLKTLQAGLRLVAAELMCGAAWCWLRLQQARVGGNRESRY